MDTYGMQCMHVPFNPVGVREDICHEKVPHIANTQCLNCTKPTVLDVHVPTLVLKAGAHRMALPFAEIHRHA